jgi:hypothetical protein
MPPAPPRRSSGRCRIADEADAPPTCLHPRFPLRDNERAESSFLKTRKILLNIARAWRERVDEAEKKIKDTPSSVDGD